MLRIGITGGTGSGKTTLLRELERRGAALFDCDEVYHTLLKENRQMLGELESSFPEAFRNGELERKELGKIVFSDPEKLERLNNITHRFVDEYVDREIEQAAGRGVTLAAVDAIALFESGMAAKCDATIAVLAEPENPAEPAEAPAENADQETSAEASAPIEPVDDGVQASQEAPADEPAAEPIADEPAAESAAAEETAAVPEVEAGEAVETPAPEGEKAAAEPEAEAKPAAKRRRKKAEETPDKSDQETKKPAKGPGGRKRA